MKTSKLVIASALFLGVSLSFGTKAFADTTTDATVGYADGGIIFDPQVPGDPSASLPTDLNFGSHPIQSTTDETWTATTDGVQTSAATTGSVAVSDNRGDALGGWSVKVVQQDQFSNGTSTLTGAALTITAGGVTNNLNSLPTEASIANSSLTLDIGTTADVLAASAQEGEGETSLALNKFELFVPKDVEKKQVNYAATLNWTFSDAP